MKLFNIKHRQIKSFTKEACRAMLISFSIAKSEADRGKLQAKVYGDLVAKALSTRPKWEMTGENIFQYTNGERIEVKEEDSLADVILGIVLIEMEEFIMNDSNPEEILGIITNEFTNFFSAVPEDEIGTITRRNPEWIRMLGAVTMHKMGHRGLQ